MSRPGAVPLTVVAACTWVACGSSISHPAATAPDKADAVATQVRRAVAPLYEREALHGGMVVALIEPTRENGVTYLGFGHTSAEVVAPPGADAVFEIGSVSKLLTSLLLADEVVRGEVTLETKVAELLPFGVRFPDKDGVAVTLAHLASHRSGLPTLPDNLDPTAPDPYAKYGTRELNAYLERAQLMFTPGTHFAYSNLGTALLGDLLAKRIGAPYEQAMIKRVLRPLGLTETWMHVPVAAKARIVPGTAANGTPVAPWTFDVFAAAGAWRSTPRDLVKLIEVAAEAAAGKKVPLGDALRLSFQPVGDGNGDAIAQVGLGWLVSEDGILWHNGQTGGQSSFVGFDPKTAKGVVILASTASPLTTRLGIGVFQAYLGKELDLGLDLVDVPPAELDKLVGSYRRPDGVVIEVARTGKSLELVGPAGRIRVFPRSPTQFVILEFEASIDFAVENGRVLGLVFHTAQGDLQFERVEAKP